MLLSKSLRMLNCVWRLFQRSNTDFEFAVDTLEAVSYYALRQHDTIIRYGAIAQLGERLHGMQEVSGSIPLISTIFTFLLFVFHIPLLIR